MRTSSLVQDVERIKPLIKPGMTCHDVAQYVESELGKLGYPAEMTATYEDGTGHFWVTVGNQAVDLWADEQYPAQGIVPAQGEYQGYGRSVWS